MIRQMWTAVLVLFALTVLTGGIYPVLVTIVAQLALPDQANGSVVRVGKRAVGSSLVGQAFARPEYFWGRLSATVPGPYNAAASSGSNLGPLHPQLVELAKARLAALRAAGSTFETVPVDLVTASGSGLDPHISLASAELQVPRVATSRRISEERIQMLVRRHTQRRQFGILGEPRVNVLLLNLALDREL